jgi:hypothetical protein
MFLFPALLNPAEPAGLHDIRRYALHPPVCNGFFPALAKWASQRPIRKSCRPATFGSQAFRTSRCAAVVKSILGSTQAWLGCKIAEVSGRQPSARPDQSPSLAALPCALSLVVVARALLDRAMLGLLHRLRQPDSLPRRLGQISSRESMRGKRLRLQPGHGAAPLDDQIDRLRRERPFPHRFPAVDRPEDRPLRDGGPLQPFAQRLDRRADQKHHPPRRPRRAWSGQAELRGTARSAISDRADRAAPAAHPSAARRAAAPLRCGGARRTRTPREGSRDPGYRPDDPSRRLRSPDPGHLG